MTAVDAWLLYRARMIGAGHQRRGLRRRDFVAGYELGRDAVAPVLRRPRVKDLELRPCIVTTPDRPARRGQTNGVFGSHVRVTFDGGTSWRAYHTRFVSEVDGGPVS